MVKKEVWRPADPLCCPRPLPPMAKGEEVKAAVAAGLIAKARVSLLLPLPRFHSLKVRKNKLHAGKPSLTRPSSIPRAWTKPC